MRILQTPIAWNQGEDSLWWPFSKSGEFSVKSGYFQSKRQEIKDTTGPSTSVGVSPFVWKEIWDVKVPQKIKFFLWKLCHNALPVGQNLCKKRIKNSPLCQLCEKEEESIEHMLLFCEWTRVVWFGLQVQCVPSRTSVTSIHQWLGKMFTEFDKLQDFKVYAKMSLCCALWSIWKGRNQAIFDSKMPNPNDVLNKINLLQKDYYDNWANLSRNVQSQGQSIQISRAWRPPLSGCSKINSDASFSKQKKLAWAGIVVRNDEGNLIAGLTKMFPATSPLMAEALSFRESLAFANSMGMQRIVVESDCLELIKSCRNEIVRGEIINVTRDIEALKGEFQQVGFTWIAREGNQVAHSVALLASQSKLPCNWTWNLPLCVKSLIQADKLAAVTSGFPFDPGRSATNGTS